MSNGFSFAERWGLVSEDMIAVREVIPINVNQKEETNDDKVARRRNKVTADGKKKTGYPKRTIRCGTRWDRDRGYDGEARLDARRERRLGREYDGNRRSSRGRIRRYRGITEGGERTIAEMNVFETRVPSRGALIDALCIRCRRVAMVTRSMLANRRRPWPRDLRESCQL